jgi:hypothetical protein
MTGKKGSGSDFHQQLLVLTLTRRLERSAPWFRLAPLACGLFNAIEKAGIPQRLTLSKRHSHIIDCLGRSKNLVVPTPTTAFEQPRKPMAGLKQSSRASAVGRVAPELSSICSPNIGHSTQSPGAPPAEIETQLRPAGCGRLLPHKPRQNRCFQRPINDLLVPY